MCIEIFLEKEAVYQTDVKDTLILMLILMMLIIFYNIEH